MKLQLTGRLAGAILFSAALIASAGASRAGISKGDILFHLDGESLKSPYSDASISGSIRQADGKYGKALLIERRTVNLVPNGDFKTENMDGWVPGDLASRVATGGIGGGACLSAKDGASIAIPLTELTVNTHYAFSFYAKSAGAGKVAVELSMGGTTSALGTFDTSAGDFKRFAVTFDPTQDAGTLRLKVAGDTLLDNVQLEKSATYANTFSEPLKIRGVDVINIPAGGKYINLQQGSVSCWVDTPWLDGREQSDQGGTLFGVQWLDPDYTGWGRNTVLTINSWQKSKLNKVTQGNLYLIMIDRQKRQAGVVIPLERIKPAKWHLLVFNWKFENDQMMAEAYVDGEDIYVTKTVPFGPLKPVESITAGYCGGSYLDGRMDEFTIYGRPLAKDEVLSIFKSGKPLMETVAK